MFTTRPDTLFGATYMVLAPEHELVAKLTTAGQRTAIDQYREQAARKSELERTELQKTKTGVFTGGYAVNPVNQEKLPIWIADYVLMSYGTGAIMAVPCGDQRDFEFARRFSLPIIAIQDPTDGRGTDCTTWTDAFVGDAPYINSANESLDLNGVTNIAEAKSRTNLWLAAHGHGAATVTYKLRD